MPYYMILSAFKFLFSNTASYLLKECLDSKSIKMMIFKVILDGFDTKMSRKKKKKHLKSINLVYFQVKNTCIVLLNTH
jgi:hypothetical protein